MASVARYYNMDKTVTAFAKSYAESNIVYLGAGLETAYDRLSDKIENRTVHWYEADLPEVIEARKKVFGQRKNETLIAGDMFKLEWVKEIDNSLPTLLIVSGVFQYFHEEEIIAFIKGCGKAFPKGEMLFDATSESGLKFTNWFIKRTGNANQCGMSIPKEEGIERINVVIFGLKNTTMIPYILYIAKNVQDKNELNKMYGILESYIMRRVVVHASTKSYNNLFTSLILNKVLDSQTLTLRLKGIGDATTYCPDDNEMKIGFETSKLVNLQSKGIIYLLESKIRSDNSSTALLGFNNYSLEHLMPKKWRNNWGACATEDDAKKRDSLLLTLGNLAIIPQALNASIRDAAWNVKKAGKGQNKPGLLLCASGLYTLHDVLQKNDWNEHEIENRAEWLLANAQNIWKI